MLLTFIAALIFAFIFSAVLAVGFKRSGPGPIGGFIYFFLLILFFSWAVGSWLTPFGPVMWDVPWLNFFVVAFIIMLFMAVLLPPVKPKVLPDSPEERISDGASVTFGLLFWILIIALLFIGGSKMMYISPGPGL